MVIPITQVAKGIFRIGPLDTKRVTAATSPYLVVGSNQAMVLEPGEEGQVPELIQAIKDCDVDLNRITYVWPSHIHLHHMQGVPTLLEKLTKAKVLVHPRAVPHLIDPTRLVASSIEAWGDKCYGPFRPIAKDRIMTVEDKQVIDLGGRELEIIWAPGHAPHHMGLFDRNTRALFPGDLVTFPGYGRPRGRHDIRPPLFDVEQFVASVNRFRTYKPSMLLIFNHIGGSLDADDTLKWAAEDHLALERICLDGLRKKLTFREIVRQAEAYEDKVAGKMTAETQQEEAVFSTGGLFGLIAYLKRKYPELELPADARPRMR